MSTLRSAFVATLRAIATDRYAAVSLIGAVVLYSMYYPAAYRHQVASDFPVVIVDDDHGPVARAVTRAVDAVRATHVVSSVASVDEARRWLDRGEAEGLVLLPAGLERDVWRGTPADVAVVVNAGYLGRASAVVQGASEAVGAVGAQLVAARAAIVGAPASPPLRIVRRPLFNTREGYGSSVVPAVAQLIVHQTLMIGVLVLAGTRREQLGALAFSRAGLAGIALAFIAIGLASTAYFNGLIFWLQDYPRGGNFGGLVLAAVLYVAAAVAFALFVGSYFRTRERPFQLVAMSSLPMYFLAGISWPVEAMPAALRGLAHLLPTTPGIRAMVAVHPIGASVRECAPELVNLAVLVLLYGALAAWRYRPRPPAIVATASAGTASP